MNYIISIFIIIGIISSVYGKGFDIDSMKKGKQELLNRNYFITTSLNQDQLDEGLGQTICTQLVGFIKHYNQERPYHNCIHYNTDQNLSMTDIYNAEKKIKESDTPKYKYHYHIKQLSKNKYEYKVVNLNKREEDIDFEKSSYFIINNTEKEFIDELKKTAFISLEYDKKSLRTKMMFVKATLDAKDSKYELVSSHTGAIIQNKKSKIKYGVMKYYEMLKNDDKKKNYLRAILEVVGIYGFAGASYIAQSDTPEISAGFHYDWGDVFDYSKRVRFDDEGPGFNWGHVLAGMLVHTIFKSNNFTRLESFVATLLVSTAWENFFEYREVWSINDQIFTIFAGSSMALATEVVCDKFLSSNKKDKLFTKVLSFLHNPFCTMNRLQDGRTHISPFDKDEMSSVEILGRMSYNDTTGKSSIGIELNSDIVDLPIKGAGKIKRLLLDPRIAKIEILGTANLSGLDEIRGFTQVALAAYHIKNMELSQDQILTGYSFVFSLTTGTEFHSRASDKNEDWFGVANVLGGKIELFYFFRGIKFRMGVNVSGDVAMARSYGYNSFIKNNGQLSGEPQDILVNTQADFYWGSTSRLDLSLEGKIKGSLGGLWKVGASIADTHVKNFEGLQRNSDDMDNLVTLKEDIRKFKVYFSYGPNAFENLKFKLSYEELYRKGNIFSTLDQLSSTDSGTQRQVTFSVIYSYL